MSCFLFDKIIFGPVISRRLGTSLGINLLPHNKKICTFNCIYCECGWTKPGHFQLESPYAREDVKAALDAKLSDMSTLKSPLDSITFGGNGEPTIHPHFPDIVEDVVSLRNKYFPDVIISLLSNATHLGNPAVVNALKKIDKPILKLDAGSENIFRLLNKPLADISLKQIVDNLCAAKIEKMVIQTLFLKGTLDGQPIDNTTEAEVAMWLAHLERIRPQAVMIYGIDRETPARNLEKIPNETLESIALRVKSLGIEAEAY